MRYSEFLLKALLAIAMFYLVFGWGLQIVDAVAVKVIAG